MKTLTLMMLMIFSSNLWAEKLCDVRMGTSSGVNVIEFATGNIIHSKMSLKDSSALALKEEIINLQDMGICLDKIQAKKCVLKLEKVNKSFALTFYRGQDRWMSWKTQAKKHAQTYIKNLKREGFCS